jgi:hypothetical protein
MSTLPGLPMFGHGQIEGYGERYGMEFKQAKMDEWPNEGLVARHQAEIAPLLKQRHIFAESANFLLYDFWADNGTVNENVFAYSNNFHGERSLIIYNNSYSSCRGTIHHSAASMDKGSGELRQRSLAQGLALSWGDDRLLAYRDHSSGLEYLRWANSLHSGGMSFDLRGYQYVVLLNWRELTSTAEQPWGELANALNGAGVYSLEDALSKLRLRPLHEALRQAIAPQELDSLILLASEVGSKSVAALLGDARLESFAAKAQTFLELSAEHLQATSAAHTAAPCRQLLAAALRLPLLQRSFSPAWPDSVAKVFPSESSTGYVWSPVIAYVLLKCLPLGEDRAATFDRLQLRAALAECFSAVGMEGERPWQAAAMVRTLLAFSGPDSVATQAFWQDGDVRWLIGVNEASGVQYANKERFEEVLSWMQLPALLNAAEGKSKLAATESGVETVCQAMAAAGYAVGNFLKQVTPVAAEAEPAKKPAARRAAKSTSVVTAADEAATAPRKAPAKRTPAKKAVAVVTSGDEAAPKPAAKKAAPKKTPAKKPKS